jgi:hypothetical protein
MALTDKQSNIAAGAIFLGLATYIGFNIATGTQTPSQIMQGITQGLIPTAADGVNNPLDLRTSTIAWQGKITPQGNAFEQYETMWQGYRAGIDTIKAHYKQGQRTLIDILQGTYNTNTGNYENGFAPAADKNDPGSYAANVAAYAGISPTEDVGPYLSQPDMLSKIVTGFALEEQGHSFTPNPADIQMAMVNLGIAPTA